MTEVGSAFRRRARSFVNRERPTATSYPESFREEAVALARERRSWGVPITRIAAELGLQHRTLSLWLRRAPKRPVAREASVPKRRVRRVTVAPAERVTSAQAASGLFAVSVGAVRVEGLDLSGVVSLVRALAS